MHFHRLSFLILIFFINLQTPSCAQKDTDSYDWFEIDKFIDGDTFWVINTEGNREKIRLIGVDAPKSRRSGRKEIGYYGKEASAYVESLLSNTRVRLEYDVSKYDRYKRTLAYVYLEDGTFLNGHLVEEGYATVMTVPPNVKFADYFVKLQRKARAANKGLWGD